MEPAGSACVAGANIIDASELRINARPGRARIGTCQTSKEPLHERIVLAAAFACLIALPVVAQTPARRPPRRLPPSHADHAARRSR